MEEEDQQNYSKSIDLYSKAIQSLNLAISFEGNHALKDIIHAFISTYDHRCASLRFKLQSRQSIKRRKYSHNVMDTEEDQIGEFPNSSLEMARALRESDLVYKNQDPVVGLEEAKEILKEAIVLPRMFPEIFQVRM